MMKTFEGELTANNCKIAIVVSRWNEFINQQLLSGALNVFERSGGKNENIFCVKVPGAFEIPTVCAAIANKKQVDGILALGTVIRGATPHFDYVAGAAVNGVHQVSLQHNIPVGMGILTTDTIEQAIERAGTKAGNKGSEAMSTLIEMINTLKLL